MNYTSRGWTLAINYHSNFIGQGVLTLQGVALAPTYDVTVTGQISVDVTFNADRTFFTATETTTANAHFEIHTDPTGGGYHSFDPLPETGTEPLSDPVGSIVDLLINNGDATASFVGSFTPDLSEITGNATIAFQGFSGSIPVPIDLIQGLPKSMIEIDSYTGSIGERHGPITVTLSRSFDVSQEASVRVDILDGTAVKGVNYDLSGYPDTTPAIVTFAAGEASKTITIATKDDFIIKPDLDLEVQLSSPVNATLGTSTADIEITDEDQPPHYPALPLGTLVLTGVSGAIIPVPNVGTGEVLAVAAGSIAHATISYGSGTYLTYAAPLTGGVGNKFLAGSGQDRFLAGSGNNTYVAGTGTAIVDYSLAPQAVSINLLNGNAANGFGGTDTLNNIHNVAGSAFNDTFIGSAGNDVIDGGGGSDTVSYSSAIHAIVVNLASAHDQATGADIGTDQLSNIENVVGGSGNDRIAGNALNNFLDGGAGSDTAVFTGGMASYGITYDAAAKTFAFADLRAGSPDGTDTLKNFEIFQFSDGHGSPIFDTTNVQAWSAYIDFFDSSNAHTSRHGFFDDGGSWMTTFDAHNVETWSSYIDFFDSNGAHTSRQGTFDDGGTWTTTYDAHNVEAWSSYIDFFDRNGAHTSRQGTFDDSSTWTITYDAHNVATWSSYIDFYDRNGAETSEQGTFDNGSRWTTTYDAHNVEAWSFYVDYFDQNGAHTSRQGAFDDGRTWTTTYDTHNVEAWSSYADFYDQNGAHTSRQGNFDDGSSWTITYDAHNAQPWSSYIDFYDRNGAQTSEQGTFDNGATWITTYDAHNAEAWSYYTDFFDQSGAHTLRQGAFDDGSTWTITYDAHNTQTWSSYIDFYDRTGAQTSEQGTFDNGSRWTTTYDAHNVEAWSFYVDYFDQNGAHTSRQGAFDDGRTWTTTYDTHNVEAWSSYADFYDQNGAHTSRQGNFDDGSSWTITYDPNNTHEWSSYVDFYDANGAHTLQQGTFDNGGTWTTHYDPYNVENWSSYMDTFNAAGQFVSRNGIFDDGSTWHI
jgi:hypothetical protein